MNTQTQPITRGLKYNIASALRFLSPEKRNAKKQAICDECLVGESTFERWVNIPNSFDYNNRIPESQLAIIAKHLGLTENFLINN